MKRRPKPTPPWVKRIPAKDDFSVDAFLGPVFSDNPPVTEDLATAPVFCMDDFSPSLADLLHKEGYVMFGPLPQERDGMREKPPRTPAPSGGAPGGHGYAPGSRAWGWLAAIFHRFTRREDHV